MSQKLKSIIWKTPKGVFKKMSSRNIPALVTIPGRSSRNMTPLPCWCNSGTERMARPSANCSLGDQWYSQVAAKAQVERGKTILWISPFKKSFKQRHEWKECQDWICRWLQCQGTFLWKPIKMWLSPVFPGCITSPWWVWSDKSMQEGTSAHICAVQHSPGRAALLLPPAPGSSHWTQGLGCITPLTAPASSCPSPHYPHEAHQFGWSFSGPLHPELPHWDVPAPHCPVFNLIPSKIQPHPQGTHSPAFGGHEQLHQLHLPLSYSVAMPRCPSNFFPQLHKLSAQPFHLLLYLGIHYF